MFPHNVRHTLVCRSLPYTLFEEGHILHFTHELTFETDVNEIIGQKFAERDVVLLQEGRREALLNLRDSARRCLR